MTVISFLKTQPISQPADDRFQIQIKSVFGRASPAPVNGAYRLGKGGGSGRGKEGREEEGEVEEKIGRKEMGQQRTPQF